MQLSLISGKQMHELLVENMHCILRATSQGPTITLPLTTVRIGWSQWVHVGCANTGSSTHPVPPSALVADRKYHHESDTDKDNELNHGHVVNNVRQ